MFVTSGRRTRRTNFLAESPGEKKNPTRLCVQVICKYPTCHGRSRFGPVNHTLKNF